VAAFSAALLCFRFLLKNSSGVFVLNVISRYGRPRQFALIRFYDDSVSVFVPHSVESWISYPKKSELHLTASLFRYPNRKTTIR